MVFSDVVYADNKFKAKLKLFDLYKDLGLKHRKGCDLDADNIPVNLLITNKMNIFVYLVIE